MSTHKLCIGDMVQFQARISVLDGAIKKDFSFTLEGRRVTDEEIRASYEAEADKKLSEFHAARCREGLTGWRDQRLVLGDDDQPAPFSPEALDLVLAIPGAATIFYNAYMEAIVVSTGLQGRAKN